MLNAHKDGLTTGFMQRVLFVALTILTCILVVKLVTLWLMIFGAIIVAVILRVMAEPIMRFTKLSEGISVVLALLIFMTVISIVIYLFGREMVIQSQNLTAQLPKAWEALQTRLQGSETGLAILDQINGLGDQAGSALSKAPKWAGDILSTVGNILLVLVAGIFLAMNPTLYRDGLVRLFTPDLRPKVSKTLNLGGHALRLWFMGQFISMLLVGSLTAIGLSVVGVPSALALGLISGLAQFIPIVGPVISSGPGLILAGADGWQTFVWAMIVYVGVSQLEANLITPFVQNQIASIPSLLTIFSVIGFAILLGPLGIVFATPLAVVLYTWVKSAYEPNDEAKTP